MSGGFDLYWNQPNACIRLHLIGYKNSGLDYLKYSIFKANFIKFMA